MSIRRKPFIPGERKSARNARPEVTESSTNGETVSSASDLDPSLGGTQVPMVVLDGSRRSKGMKGYAFVPHERPFEMLTPKEQRSLSDQQVTTANGVTPSTNEHDRDEARMELDSGEATGEGRSSVREESEEEEAIEGVIEAGA